MVQKIWYKKSVGRPGKCVVYDIDSMSKIWPKIGQFF